MIDTTVREPRASGMRCCDRGARPTIRADEADALSESLQILAHPIRIQIFDLLAHYAGQACVCDLEAALPVKQPTVSHHLKILRDTGLIDCDRQGLWAYYVIQHDRLTWLRDQVKYLFDTLASQG